MATKHHSIPGVVQRVAGEARDLGVKDGARLLKNAFARNDLTTFSSAISFQLLFALIPFVLFALALVGGSGLRELWTADLGPRVGESVSPAAYTLIDDTVRSVLSSRQTYWLTAGALFALWQMSGAVRAVMGALNRIYGNEEERQFAHRFAISVALGAAIMLLLVIVVATMQLLPAIVQGGAVGVAVTVLRWPVALLLLWAIVTLVLKVGPVDRPAGRVTLGSTIVIVAWLLSSVVYGAYLTNVAQYGSIFGALATVVISLTYLYISTTAFLVGVQLDALIQERVRTG